MDFELTDDDIREAWHKVDVQKMRERGIPLYIEYQYIKVTDEDMAIAKASQKKLVETFEQEMSTAPMGLRLARFEKCLQELRKGVGL